MLPKSVTHILTTQSLPINLKSTIYNLRFFIGSAPSVTSSVVTENATAVHIFIAPNSVDLPHYD